MKKYRTTVYYGSSALDSMDHDTAEGAVGFAINGGQKYHGCCVYDLITRGDCQIARIGDRDEYITNRTKLSKQFNEALAKIRPLPPILTYKKY